MCFGGGGGGSTSAQVNTPENPPALAYKDVSLTEARAPDTTTTDTNESTSSTSTTSSAPTSAGSGVNTNNLM